ncbi:VanZ family protein [Limnobacter parvus]|uniref:VanZ family protein n=1 Tax=Limnobacter parvus TaxID=2939690 RepID=A0ABT1XII2_9BURK|nr:VanZ family protein [Limnobacter parvus]MCR2747081.1 VanZ family protein [Limnobacter parvus]
MPPIHSSLLKRTPYTGILMFASLYACVVIHLSLFPYSGWRHIGIGPLEFLFGPWIPVHQTVLWGDIMINTLGYIPLGFLMLLGLNKQPRTFDKILAVLLCMLISFALESVQTFLPSRVPSKMDLATNTMGAALGVMIGIYVTAQHRIAPSLNRRLEHWLIQRAWIGMGLLSLWFISIFPPQNPTFSTGLWLGNLFEIPDPLQQGTPFGIPLEVLLHIETMAPTFINYCFLMCAWMIGLAQTHAGSPRARLLIVLIILTLLIRLLDYLVLAPMPAWSYLVQRWFEANSLGLAIAFVASLAISMMPVLPHHMARIGLIHLLAGWLITLLLPGVHDPELGDPGTGVLAIFRTLQEAGRWVSELWPILAVTVLTFLSLPERRFRR